MAPLQRAVTRYRGGARMLEQGTRTSTARPSSTSLSWSARSPSRQRRAASALSIHTRPTLPLSALLLVGLLAFAHPPPRRSSLAVPRRRAPSLPYALVQPKAAWIPRSGITRRQRILGRRAQASQGSPLASSAAPPPLHRPPPQPLRFRPSTCQTLRISHALLTHSTIPRL